VYFEECLEYLLLKRKLVVFRVIEGVLFYRRNVQGVIVFAHGRKKVIYVGCYVEWSTGFRGVIKGDPDGRFVLVFADRVLFWVRTSFLIAVRGLDEDESAGIRLFFRHGDVGFHRLFHVGST